MFLVDLIVQALLQLGDDDLFDDDAIDNGDDEKVEDNGERQFKSPVCRVGQEFHIFGEEVSALMGVGGF